MRRLVALLVCAGSFCVSTPALAVGGAEDVTVTRAYLRASESYARRAYAEAAASAAAVEARASGIATECPAALTYAPRDAAFGELVELTEMVVAYADVVPVRAARLRLAGAIAPLSWSSRKLTRLVHSQAVAERSIATLALPDVCADIAAWRTSAYATLPASVTGFLGRLRPIEMGVGPSQESREAVIVRLLKPYEDAGEKRVVSRMEKFEMRAYRRLAAAIAAASRKLAAALGVSAL
jgi:hypothetical protein